MKQTAQLTVYMYGVQFNTCSDVPLCEPADVAFLPDVASVETMEAYLEEATAISLVTNVPALSDCKKFIRQCFQFKPIKNIRLGLPGTSTPR